MKAPPSSAGAGICGKKRLSSKGEAASPKVYSRYKRHSSLFSGGQRTLSRASIRRLARRGGVKRINSGVYGSAHEALVGFITAIVRDAATYADYCKRKTLMVVDVLLALKRHGRTLYWSGDEDAVAALVQKRVDKITKPLGGYRRQSTSTCTSLDNKSEEEGPVFEANDKENIPPPETVQRVQKSLAEIIRERRLDYEIPITDLTNRLKASETASNPRPSDSQVETVLSMMEADNRIMLRNRRIYIL